MAAVCRTTPRLPIMFPSLAPLLAHAITLIRKYRATRPTR